MNKKYLVTKASGEAMTPALALQKAYGVAGFGAGVVEVAPFTISSEWKEDVHLIEGKEGFESGAIVAKCEGVRGETIHAGIALGEIFNRLTGKRQGVLTTSYSSLGEIEEVKKVLEAALFDLYQKEYEDTYELKNCRTTIETKEVNEAFGAVVAAIGFLKESKTLVYPAFFGKKIEAKEAKSIVIPVPSTSGLMHPNHNESGVSKILEASAQIEDYDVETNAQVKSVYTWPVSQREEVEELCKAALHGGKVCVVIGGDAGVSIGAFKAMSACYSEFSILQLSGKAGLRPSFNGSPLNSACTMHEARKYTKNVVQVGLKSVSNREKDLIDYEKTFFARDIHRGNPWIDDVVDELKGPVYITIDASVFSPCLLSSEAPIAGGLLYDDVLDLVKKVAKTRKIVGFDLVGYKPNGEFCFGAHVAAKLIQQCLAFIQK